MAVYTEVSDAALAGFLQGYDLGNITAFKGIAGGVENTNYLLQTTTGSYILTLYERRVAEADLPFFMELMDHLAGQGFPCPKPVLNLNGQALGRLEGRAAALVTFLDGVDTSSPSIDQCRKAGAGMARMHASADGMSLTRANALSPSGWPPLLQTALNGADSVEGGLADLMTNEMDYLVPHWPQNLPGGVIHADWFCDNVFFLDGELSGVIDFYFACNDFLAYDLAIAINAWAFDKKGVFHPERSAALIGGYCSERQLSEAERVALPVLCRGSALRFLLTRVNDWLNVPTDALVIPHDPKPFSARLRFHQQVARPQVYGA